MLIPGIQLADSKSKQAFNTEGITTAFKGPDSVPRNVLDTYEFVCMNGTAESVILPLAVTAKSA